MSTCLETSMTLLPTILRTIKRTGRTELMKQHSQLIRQGPSTRIHTLADILRVRAFALPLRRQPKTPLGRSTSMAGRGRAPPFWRARSHEENRAPPCRAARSTGQGLDQFLSDQAASSAGLNSGTRRWRRCAGRRAVRLVGNRKCTHIHSSGRSMSIRRLTKGYIVVFISAPIISPL